ncbi:MAG: HD domain-containing phosphohydrolase [Planctomycetota bacterium]
MAYKLFVAAGVSKGKVFPVREPETVIGRDPTCTAVIPDTRMSRRHCRIQKVGPDFFLEDLRSTNGTFANGRAVTRAKLASNDQIVLGSSVLYFAKEAPAKLASRSPVNVVEDGPDGEPTYEVSVAEVRAGYTGEAFDDRAREERDRAARSLFTIYEIGQTVHSARDVPELLEKVLDVLFDAVDADRGYVVLMDPQTGDLTPTVSRTHSAADSADLSISRSILRKVLEEDKGVLSGDAMTDERFRGSDSVILQQVHSVLCAPLKGTSRVLGMLYLATRGASDAFSVDNLRLATAVGLQAGVVLENVTLFEENRELLLGALRSLVAMLELRDPYTSGHAERVSAYCLAMCDALGLDSRDRQEIELTALLHDIGKIVIPDSILKKPDSLSPSERAVVQEHPIHGAAILARIKGTEALALGVKHHHERYDGAGYPDGLAGEKISLTARMLAIADAFDAMHSERPYRGALSLDQVLRELEEGAGTHFDPVLVNVFIKAVETGVVHLSGADAAGLPTQEVASA